MFSGRDDSGAVRVAVNREGLVADVAVAHDWRDVAAPQALGHALLVAANNGVYEMVADQVEHMGLNATAISLPAVPAGLTMTEVVDLPCAALPAAFRPVRACDGAAERTRPVEVVCRGPRGPGVGPRTGADDRGAHRAVQRTAPSANTWAWRASVRGCGVQPRSRHGAPTADQSG